MKIEALLLIALLLLCSLSICLTLKLQTKRTVWTEFGELAQTTGGVNLGQGFPDWDPPEFVLDSLKRSSSHQYTRPAGHPQLVELLAARYSKHMNREVDPLQNVAVTVGASQALYLSLTSLLQRGDEIIVFDPFFELYTKQIALTGATPKFVPLGGPSATLDNPWALDVDALRRLVCIRFALHGNLFDFPISCI